MASLRLLLNSLLLLLGLALAGRLAHTWSQSQPLPWRSLASGRAMALAQGLPEAADFTFTAPAGARFDTARWAYDWAAYQLHRLYGASALTLASTLALAAAFVFLLAAGFQRGSRPFSTALFSLGALACSLPLLSSGAAPWGLACAALGLALAEGPFWDAFHSRWIWLAPLAVLWVNLHPSALGLAPVLALWLAMDGDPREEGASLQPRLAKLSTLVLLSACLLLQPGFWRLPLSLAGLAPTPLLPGSFGPSQGALLFLVGAFLLTVASTWVPGGRSSLRRDAVLLTALGAFSLVSADALPYACLLAAPLSAARADLLVDALPSPLQALRWPLKLGALGAGAWLLLQAQAPTLAAEPAPKQTLAFYRDELLDLRLLTEGTWRELTLWELGPAVKLDSLPGLRAAPQAGAALAALRSGARGWEEAAAKLGMEGALLGIGSPLAKAMAYARGWQPLSFDNASVLYVRALPPQEALIKRYAPRGLRPGDVDEPLDPTRLAQAEADLEVRLAKDPGLGRLHWMKGRLKLEQGRPTAARQALEAGLKADPGFVPLYTLLARLRGEAGDHAGQRQLLELARRLEAGGAP